MNNKKQKTSLKFVCAIAMSLFSLVALFVGTFAWFQSCRTQLANGDSFGVDKIVGKFSKVTFHTLNSKEVASDPDDTLFHFNSNPVGTITYDWDSNSFSSTGNTAIQLEEYQPLNPEQPLLLLIELTDNYNTSTDGLVSVTAYVDSTLTTGFLGERDSNNDPVNDLSEGDGIISTISNKPYYPLSSVTQFYAKSFELNLDEDDVDLNDYFNYRVGDTSKPTNNFVTVNNSNETTNFNPSITIYQSPNNIKVNYVALIIDYFPDAIDYIYSTYLGDPTLEDEYEYSLSYICDWTMEVH